MPLVLFLLLGGGAIIVAGGCYVIHAMYLEIVPVDPKGLARSGPFNFLFFS